MRLFYGYIRVSTAKQGEGVSLQEQRSAIERYAAREGLTVVEWFEERETAAKRGRSLFGRMLRLLRAGKARGVVIHKIDRSARNLKDWADLGELLDSGVDVRFANESLDLATRGGRLSADIQAVVAADFIRNLREETRKGFYGRLKQGLYPLPAPVGYVDRGKGKVKEIDPVMAPLVRQAFDLYASGRYNLRSLLAEMNRRGLRNRRGKPMTLNGISFVLNNPFYMGVIRLRRTKEAFAGAHQAILSPEVFRRVHDVLRGKTNTRPLVHDFTYRRLVACAACRRTLIGELQKGHVYYRCHTRECPETGVREETLDRQVETRFARLVLSDAELRYVAQHAPQLLGEAILGGEDHRRSLTLRLAQVRDRLGRLTDAYLDGAIERDLLNPRKESLLVEEREVMDEISRLEATDPTQLPARVVRLLELIQPLPRLYKTATPQERRELLRVTTSNREVARGSLAFTMLRPYGDIEARALVTNGAPYRGIPRIWGRLLPELANWLKDHPNERQYESMDALRAYGRMLDERPKSTTCPWTWRYVA